MKIKFLPILLLSLWFALRTFAIESLPLAGQWRFALDRNDTGTTEHWFTQKLPDKIQLPGILESQGYGDEISTTTPWASSSFFAGVMLMW